MFLQDDPLADCKKKAGGQAVIEGIMMRGPLGIATAVRAPDGNIIINKKNYVSWTKRFFFGNWPFVRGGLILIESLLLGLLSLEWSASIAMPDEEKAISEKKSERRRKIEMYIMMFISFAVGLGLFFLIPLFLTKLTQNYFVNTQFMQGSIMFNLIDAIIRLAFFLIYIIVISRLPEIQRVFQYHGAEHKTIFTYEEDKELKLENIRPNPIRHPRCGTSFLIFVMIVSFIVFVLIGKPDTFFLIASRILLLPVIAGISYEIIRFAGNHMDKKWVRIFIAPGIWLQHFTTREPDDKQIEVGIESLKAVIDPSYYEKVNND
ncbi:MAG: DUF1385 domain-containing protein [Candidatus Coatesbacteria bacterium]|nr:DUF1385 domain-containing protein [Candidatus Coatesbacteria bacterium]